MKKRKRNLTEVVSDITGFPESISSSTPDVRILGTRELCCDGCVCILIYESDEVSLRLKDRIMTVRGEGLTLKSFYRDRISVKGRISEVSFMEEGLC